MPVEPRALSEAEIARLAPSFYAPSFVPANLDEVVRDLFDREYRVVAGLLPETYSLDRLGSAIFYRVPALHALGRPLSELRVLELGCGNGLKALPWSRVVGRYWGVDLDPDLIGFARRAAKACGSNNLEFVVGNAAEVMRRPQDAGIDEEVDLIILYAVVEHLTMAERREVLSHARERLGGRGLLMVAECPNRLIPFDGHSSQLHFLQWLPAELAIPYSRRSPRPEAAAIAAGSDPQLTFARFGTGASHHEFEEFLGDPLPPVIADGWNLWNVFDEPVRNDELALAAYLRGNGIVVPPAFARAWIEVVFDMAAAQSAGDSRAVVLRQPSPSSGVLTDRRQEHWGLRKFHCRTGAEMRIPVADLEPELLQLDLDRSQGAFTVRRADGGLIAAYDVEDLRRRRFGRWHMQCAIEIPPDPGDEIVVSPDGRASGVTLTGVLGRQGPAPDEDEWGSMFIALGHRSTDAPAWPGPRAWASQGLDELRRRVGGIARRVRK